MQGTAAFSAGSLREAHLGSTASSFSKKFGPPLPTRANGKSSSSGTARRIVPLCAISDREKMVQHFARFATEAAQTVASQTERVLQSLSSQEELHKQTEETAAQLQVQAEQLRANAEMASARISELLKSSRIPLLSDASRQLRSQRLSGSALAETLKQQLGKAEQYRGKLLEVAKAAPEPIKDIAQTAVLAHGKEAARKGAIIHDFCLGITFGGMLVGGGLLWFLVTGSVNALRFGTLLGGILLAAAVGSMNAWRAGNSSTPYIAIQAVCSYLLFARGAARYAQTKALFPTAVVAAMSIAMVAFYVYVVLAGGNPPPKSKAQPATPEPAPTA